MVHRPSVLVALALLASAQAQGAIAAQSAPQNPAQATVANRSNAQNSSQAAPATPATILVLPLENSGGDARLDWLGEGLAELIIDRLGEEGRVVYSRDDTRATIERMGLATSTRFTRATMLRIAEQLDADYIVFGSYKADDKTLGVTLRILRQTPPQLSPPLVETGALENLMAVQSAATWRVLHYLDPDYPASKNAFAQNVSRLRLDAFESYIRGVTSANDTQRVRLWREAARLEPGWSEPSFALGKYYFAAKNYPEANSWFGRVKPEENHGIEAAFYDGVAHLLRNDPARAEDAFASLLELARPHSARGRNPAELPEALNNLAVARARLRKFEDARAAMQRAAKLDPGEPDYQFNLALAELRMEDANAAVRPLRNLAKLTPEDKTVRALLILALEKAGRKAEADIERESAPAGLPNLSVATLGGLDRVRTRLEISPAAAELQGALSPRRAAGLRRYIQRGNQFLAGEKWEEARREFTEAVLLAPDAADAHLGLADADWHLGHPEDAVREFRAALWSREDAATRVRLARLLMQLERPTEARAELRIAQRLDTEGKLREEIRQLLDALNARNDAGERP